MPPAKSEPRCCWEKCPDNPHWEFDGLDSKRRYACRYHGPILFKSAAAMGKFIAARKVGGTREDQGRTTAP